MYKIQFYNPVFWIHTDSEIGQRFFSANFALIIQAKRSDSSLIPLSVRLLLVLPFSGCGNKSEVVLPKQNVKDTLLILLIALTNVKLMSNKYILEMCCFTLLAVFKVCILGQGYRLAVALHVKDLFYPGTTLWIQGISGHQ